MTQKIDIVHVVAIDSQRCIGKDNALAWHIPADLQHFKDITTGGIIVMGRKTLESLGRLLPNRQHHVITSQADYQKSGVQIWHDIDSAILGAKQAAKTLGQSAIYIIGGGEIYQQTLPLADRLEITEVALDIQGDAFYPKFSDAFTCQQQEDWQVDEKSGVRFRFSRWLKS